ncbi:AP2-like ethylene-responsive transcription factor At1g16060 [Mercurialis annua]|uniref:AP2-like ethylene-responsive transcription factor At1g16060 n=1 Tax=Mercurialis annua TaxID=3986 RepID=UPI00215E78E1|nr:AP2-like ethylene-responsive transcription factor At1g16060 [Mercurialis annua]
MGKHNQIKTVTNNNNNNATTTTYSNGVTKAKRTRRSVPRDSPPQRSSIYRGVTRHRWTGRYEAHLWDKNCWNESQNKKGRQVYLGAYDDEEAAAHAYDLAALKYWGQETILNFPLLTYENEWKEMENQSREEYIGSLRRKSSGFSRGVSKYRGVARHHHNGRWEARIGRVFGNKYLYLGTYATQEEAATAYDMAAIEYRGLNAVTNFDLSRYIKWLKPNQNDNINNFNDKKLPNPIPNVSTHQSTPTPKPNSDQDLALSFVHTQQTYQPSTASQITTLLADPPRPATNATSALGLLLQSSKFKEMMEMTLMADNGPLTPPPELEQPQSRFPEDIQTFFECQDSSSYGDGSNDMIFGDLNSFVPQMFQCDF